MLDQFFSKLKEVFSSPDVRKKVFFTLFVIFIFRVLAAIPLPGIDPNAFIQIFGGNPFTNIFRAVTGGSLDNPSIVAVGLGPYISASIVIQLLQTVIKKLDELSKEGQRGKMIINQYTRILTVPLTILQGVTIFAVLKSRTDLLGNPSNLDVFTMIVALTAGTLLLMWLSELIAEHGVGNGPSIIIAVGIISALPGVINQDVKLITENGQTNTLILLIIGFALVIALIVFISEAVRKIPIQYASRVRGNTTYTAPASFFPIKLISAGVMPIIFASSVLLFPQILSQLILSTLNEGRFLYTAAIWLQNNFYARSNEVLWRYEGVYFILIIAFTFFYTFIAFKPAEVADNLKKSGAFIPGIRPGTSTQQYISSVLKRVTLVGAFFLGVIAVVPSLPQLLRMVGDLAITAGIGGTSILIIVSVILESTRQINSLIVTKSYEKYR